MSKKRKSPQASNGVRKSPGFGRKPEQTDVAIIGGGIAGLYCGFQLDKVKSNRKFLIAEESNHIGGRIWTTRILENSEVAPDDAGPVGNAKLGFTINIEGIKHRVEFCAEFGPMRIELELQRLLGDLIRDLGLYEDLKPFPPYESPTSEHDPKYELRGEERDQETPMDLLELAILRILGRLQVCKPEGEPVDDAKKRRDCLQKKLDNLITKLTRATATQQAHWKPILLEWTGALGEQDYQNIREYGVFDDGTFLWNMGFWNLLSEVLSHHAVMRLRDLGTFYHLIPQNPNAVEWLIFWLRGFRTTNELMGLHGGMQRITENMHNTIETSGENRIRKQLRLVGITEAAGKKVQLHFKQLDAHNQEIGDITWLANHVILAVPRGPLQKLVRLNADKLYEELDRDLASVFGFPLVKVFLTLKERWWNQDAAMANRYATMIPTRELHYFKSSLDTSRKGLIMIYTDPPASSFWSNYIAHEKESATTSLPGNSQETPELGSPKDNPRLINKTLQYLREAGVPKRVDDIGFYGIRDWAREPYLGAAHSWYPERQSWKCLKRLSAFAVGNYKCDNATHSKDELNIHICGEAYSDYQAFIEGALRSSAHVLHQIDPKNFPETPTPWLCDKPCSHSDT